MVNALFVRCIKQSQACLFGRNNLGPGLEDGHETGDALRAGVLRDGELVGALGLRVLIANPRESDLFSWASAVPKRFLEDHALILGNYEVDFVRNVEVEAGSATRDVNATRNDAEAACMSAEGLCKVLEAHGLADEPSSMDSVTPSTETRLQGRVYIRNTQKYKKR